ncbi:SpoIIE family protein phosphatase [Corticibacterium sp. UT-5YL-CI-8]|nr:SpoIIE family protein phosphatase [Tianweitania sp. UT-5YL-CI-8]
MTLTRRLVLMVAACIALAIVSISLVFGYLGRNALIEQAEGQAQAIARIVAESARLTEISLEEMEGVVIDDLSTLAFAIGSMNTMSPGELGNRLAEIVARGNASSIWLVDSNLRVIANSIGDYGAIIEGETLPIGLPHHALDALTSGKRFSLELGSPIDGVQYVGVRVDGGRALIAGQPITVLDPVRAANSVPVLLAALLNRDEIQAIQIFDDAMRMTAKIGDELPVDDVDELVNDSISGAAPSSDLWENKLLVAAPIRDSAGIAIGSTVIALSTKRLDEMLSNYLLYGAIAAAIVFAIGSAIAGVFAGRITRPVAAMTHAAREIDGRTFQPESLNGLAAQSDELGTLARVFQHMAIEVQAREEHLESLVRARTIELEQKNHLLEESKRRVEAELDAARSLQAAILPQALPIHPSYDGKATMVPARELGGDFYDFFAIDDRHLGIVIADVSGKGVPAAFFMAISRTVLQSTARESHSAGTCLAAANTVICSQNPMDLFVTTFYGILDTETGDFTYANGGHNPPLMIRRVDGSVADLPRTGGMALGVMPGLSYSEKKVHLNAGDTLFLYTDGISEAMDSEGREFTEGRLKDALIDAHAQHVDLVISGVTDAVGRFVDGAEQSDDITCLVIRYKGARETLDSTIELARAS